MIELEIDGKKITAPQGTMIIEAADDAGIRIPRFCYHKKLSIAANCRMCLVEVDKSRKPLPACATPITAGMVVRTKSAEALTAQKAVMEFLLINHPLDCPICDQGGECELQDVAMGYGSDVSRYTEGKRSVSDKNIGSLVATDMTRCIQCTRCVRFGDEIAGLPELGAVGRGEHMEIGTYIEHHLKSELSGNVIDLCPVGALTSKPFRFKARAWELEQAPTIAPHDGIGSHVFAHCLRGKVMRVVPRENEHINETWISDRDRFSYEGLYSDDRLTRPLIKRAGEWQAVDWPAALEFVVEGLQKVIHQHGAHRVGALVTPTATTEEFYLLQKLVRGLGSQHIDHRLRQTDFHDDGKGSDIPELTLSFSDIELQDAILLLGTDIRREQPLLAHRVRKASLRGGAIMAINTVNYDCHFALAHKKIVKPSQLVMSLAGVAKALLAQNQKPEFAPIKDALEGVVIGEEEAKIAEALAGARAKSILLGAVALHHPHASTLKALARLIEALIGASVAEMTDGANASGAWLAGAVPHREASGELLNQPGFTARQMLHNPLKAYLLLGIEPELDSADPVAMRAALHQAEFVVSLNAFEGNAREWADVILPIAPFAETSGTYVNLAGQWQTFNAVTPPLGETRPAWKVLRVLGNLFNLPGFEYESSQQVSEELKNSLAKGAGQSKPSMTWSLLTKAALISAQETPTGIEQINEWPLYRADGLVRRAAALQQSGGNEPLRARVSSALAQRLGFVDGAPATLEQRTQSGSQPVHLILQIDENIPDGCVHVPRGYSATSSLGAIFAPLEMKRS